MPPANSDPIKVENESLLFALNTFATSCIAEEVSNYFLDAISNHYFERTRIQGSTEDHLEVFTYGELDSSGEGKRCIIFQNPKTMSLFPLRRRPRRTIVDILHEDLLSYKNSGFDSRGKRARSERGEKDIVAIGDTLSQGSCGYLYSAVYDGPARTRILSCTSCSVLHGYYLIWAETQLHITIHRQPTIIANHGTHSFSDVGDPSTAQHILPLLLSQIRSQGMAWSGKGMSPPRRPFAVTPHCNSSNPPCPRHSESFAGSASASSVLTSQSVHFSPDSALRAGRRDAFALQSMLHPRHSTVLEGYPRHMIHFGLTGYALWHATEGCFAQGGGGPGPGSLDATPSSSSSSSSFFSSNAVTRRRARAVRKGSILFTGGEGDADLVPRRDSDAILVLGLGGNVLGRCLDALLPSAVRLHVVEVEPVVLKACVAYGQLPPLEPVAPPALRHGVGGKLIPTNLNPEITPSGIKPVEFFASEPHQRGSRYRIYLEDTFHFLEEKKSQNGDSSAVDYYNMIFLDCYDPNSETMMHSRELLELCHQRLRPGGVLVVNAHFLPKREMLQKQFLGCGFASVQALRVAGLDQSIILCLRAPDPFQNRDKAPVSISQYAAFLTQRGFRFTLRNARAIAEYINDRRMLYQCEEHHREEVVETGPHQWTSSTPFTLNYAWLKSCRLLARSRSKKGFVNTITRGNPENYSFGDDSSVDLKKVCVETESCRIWEHFA